MRSVSMTDALRRLRKLLKRERRVSGGKGLADRLDEIGRHCASLPDYDTRSPDEIIGDDENGAFSRK